MTTIPKSVQVASHERTVQPAPSPSSVVALPPDPDHQQLAAIARDLRFHPGAPSRARTLTASQVDAYNRDGYLTGIPILSPSEVLAHRSWFDGLLERTLATGRDSYSIRAAHLRFRSVHALLSHPRILACVRDLIGDGVVGWGSHYFCKLPRDGKVVHWHQDASYWPLTPSKTVTAWLAIDDSRVENACMRVIPGSHHLGHLTYRMAEDSANAVLDQQVESAQEFGDPVDLILAAGQISLHSDLLLHSSGANTSSLRRCGLTLRYCAADVRAEFGWNAKGVVLCGADLSGHWTGGVPAGDD
ncbi:MAG: phytanoyl-CoA dioxygenase family protein [Planctomycetes bacterium]|nr:phytanoyl-CoA dioxygenase family protein [Planctomycetota bacterium]